MNNQYNVKVYYTDEELQAALRNDDTLQQHANIHVFSHDASAFAHLAEHPNVNVHGATGMFDKIKAWFSNDDQHDALQRFAVTPDEQQKYMTILDNGGTVVFMSKVADYTAPPIDMRHEEHVAGDVGYVEPNPMTDMPMPPTNRESFPRVPDNVAPEENPLLMDNESAPTAEFYPQDEGFDDTNKRSFNRVVGEPVELMPNTAAPTEPSNTDATSHFTNDAHMDTQQSDVAYGLHEHDAHVRNEPHAHSQQSFDEQHGERNTADGAYDLLGNGLYDVERPVKPSRHLMHDEDATPSTYELDPYEHRDLLGNSLSDHPKRMPTTPAAEQHTNDPMIDMEMAGDEPLQNKEREKHIGKAHEHRRHDLP